MVNPPEENGRDLRNSTAESGTGGNPLSIRQGMEPGRGGSLIAAAIRLPNREPGAQLRALKVRSGAAGERGPYERRFAARSMETKAG